jgi:CRISPR system Cascade subunit CasD
MKPTEPSSRYYLAEACFLVGFESVDKAWLQDLQAALQNPIWPLYLGRKAFVPAESVALQDGVAVGENLEKALTVYPYLARGSIPEQLRLVLEDPQGEYVRPDQPISFAERRFIPRRVRVFFHDAPQQRLEVI